MKRIEGARSRSPSPSGSSKKPKDSWEVQPSYAATTSKSYSKDRKINVVINYYPLNLEQLYKKKIYRMDVQFTPEYFPDRVHRKALVKFNEKYYPSVIFVYDNKYTMFTTRELEGKSGAVTVFDKKSHKTYDTFIVTSITNSIDMEMVKHYLKNGSTDVIPAEGAMAINSVLNNLRYGLTHRYSNGLETLQYCPNSLSPKIDIEELKKCFFNGWKPYIPETEVIPRINSKDRWMLSILQEDLHLNINSELDPMVLNNLSYNFKGIKIGFSFPKDSRVRRIYKVTGIFKSAEKHTFELSEDKTKFNSKSTYNVVEHYRNQWDYDIEFPHLPCFRVGRRKHAIPMELCIVMTDNMMIKRPLPPIMKRNNQISPALQEEFGIQIEESMACIPARVLEEPILAHGQNIESKPVSGAWKILPLAHTVVLSNNWAILNLDPTTDSKTLKSFETLFIDTANNLNLTVSEAKQIYSCQITKVMDFNVIKKTIFNILSMFKKENITLVVIIFSAEQPELYQIIKQLAELEVGIVTQCIKNTTLVNSFQFFTVRNILLKINTKLNGLNHRLAISDSLEMMKGAIIMGGYQVSHVSKFNERVEAAVAAMYDLQATQYDVQWRVQSRYHLFISELEDMAYQLMVKFAETTGRPPAKIIFYREGLSPLAMRLAAEEVTALRRACMRVHSGYRPPLTYMTVQKNSKMRVDSVGPSGRAALPNGTVFDSTDIGALGRPHFFLYSRPGKHSTSMPTKYDIVCNDNDFTVEQMEKITFDLCFMNTSTNRSTVHPLPVQLAYLAASRARIYRGHLESNTNEGSPDDLDTEAMKYSKMSDQSPIFFI